jgi:hypothetical protein
MEFGTMNTVWFESGITRVDVFCAYILLGTEAGAPRAYYVLVRMNMIHHFLNASESREARIAGLTIGEVPSEEFTLQSVRRVRSHSV